MERQIEGNHRMATQEVKLPDWYWKHISSDNSTHLVHFIQERGRSIVFDKRYFYNGAQKEFSVDIRDSGVIGKNIVKNTYNPMSKFPWEMSPYIIRAIFKP